MAPLPKIYSITDCRVFHTNSIFFISNIFYRLRQVAALIKVDRVRKLWERAKVDALDAKVGDANEVGNFKIGN